MVFMRSLALLASGLLCVATAGPVPGIRQETWVPGTQNNTREFYIKMTATTASLAKYDGWALQAWHTGAGEADPVFVSDSPSRAFLNGTSLQFDVGPYPFGVNALPFDDNYGRWEPVTITSGYGSGPWVNNGPDGLRVDAEESDGWLACEWYHGANAPQLFQLIKGFDDVGAGVNDIPCSCGPVLLIPQWI